MNPKPSDRGALGRPVGKQIMLPWSKAVEIAYRSIRVRFFRSLITMIGVILAIAFMMSILAGESITERLVGLNDPEINFLLQGDGVDIGAGQLADVELRQQQLWIIVLSLIVALIGIVNSMLMSVTERFREIGTMKCLGALDSFIVRLFLLESSFQGMIGTIIGIGLGLAVAIGWKTARYGLIAVDSGDLWSRFALHCVVSFGVGTLIGILAAIYPAYTAARMEPVDAMRVEE
jgi:hypothetical protein